MKTIEIIKGPIGFEIQAKDFLSNKLVMEEAAKYKFYTVHKTKFNTVRALVGDYISTNSFRKQYFFPIKRLSPLLNILMPNGYKVNVVDKEIVKGSSLNTNMLTDKTPRDYQEPVIDKIVSMGVGDSTLVCLPTGTGKTFSSCYALHKLDKKFMIYVLAKYVDKWIADIKEMYDICDDEIYVIVGKNSFVKLFNMSELERDNIKVYVCSNRTMYSYMKIYLRKEEFPEDLVRPQDLLSFIGVDTVLIDEVHQEFENVFKTMVILNPSIVIGLSATFYPTEKAQQFLYYMLFPKENFIGDIKVKPYVEYWSIAYKLRDNAIKHQGSFGYSHVEFEKSLMRNPSMLKNYTTMVINIINKFYKSNYRKGDKGLIYFSTIRMVNHMCDELSKLNSHLTISTYISGDPYETINDADLIISTLGKASTALDISNLTTVVMTVILNSESMNHQAFGRLRDLKENRENFISLHATNIPKHKRNADAKIELLSERITKLHLVPYNNMI